MRKVAVVGVGETKFSAVQDKTNVELFAEAAMEALNESNLKPKDIEALFLGNVLGDFSEGQGMVQAFAAENIGCFNIPANSGSKGCLYVGGFRRLRCSLGWGHGKGRHYGHISGHTHLCHV
jgi:acetyl-CoA C-acetyltransferase/acetyl-CoA acyltransferase